MYLVDIGLAYTSHGHLSSGFPSGTRLVAFPRVPVLFFSLGCQSCGFPLGTHLVTFPQRPSSDSLRCPSCVSLVADAADCLSLCVRRERNDTCEYNPITE